MKNSVRMGFALSVVLVDWDQGETMLASLPLLGVCWVVSTGMAWIWVRS